jgi:hypothetical protein
MNRVLLSAVLSVIVLVQSGPTAQGCGDKLLALGRGVRFQRAFAAAHPASLLIYNTPASRAALTKDRELQSALKSAGHKLVAIEDSRMLQQVLASGKYDVVLADLPEVAGLTQALQSAPSHPVIVPVIYKPDKAALAAAGRQYSMVLKAPAKPVEFLAVIDELMKRRIAGAHG